MAATTRLTHPMIAPPFPDVDGLLVTKGADLIVVRSFVHHPDVYHCVERDERKLRPVDLMDLTEDRRPLGRINRRKFLLIEGIQGRIAVESHIVSIGWDLVAGEQGGIVGIIIPAVLKLG